jgi:hypothetical protein
MNTELVRSVGRELRYRPLEHLVGRFVEVHDLGTVEEAIRTALGEDFPEGCRLVGPEMDSRQVAVARNGILDLRFSAPADLLTGAHTGLPLLRELGFLRGREVGPQQSVCDDPICLEMLQEDIDEGQVYLKLFLEGGPPEQRELPIPDGYLPRPFRIVDACVANARSVWLWKHFYL